MYQDLQFTDDPIEAAVKAGWPKLKIDRPYPLPAAFWDVIKIAPSDQELNTLIEAQDENGIPLSRVPVNCLVQSPANDLGLPTWASLIKILPPTATNGKRFFTVAGVVKAHTAEFIYIDDGINPSTVVNGAYWRQVPAGVENPMEHNTLHIIYRWRVESL